MLIANLEKQCRTEYLLLKNEVSDMEFESLMTKARIEDLEARMDKLPPGSYEYIELDAELSCLVRAENRSWNASARVTAESA